MRLRKSRKHVVVLVLGAMGALSSSCTTYKTQTAEEYDADNEKGRIVSRAGDLPYYLPKGFIRLTIKPKSGGGGGGDSTPTVAIHDNPITVSPTFTLPRGDGGNEGEAGEAGPNATPVPAVDASGNPAGALDKNGKPTFAVHPNGRPAFTYDAHGKPAFALDAKGKPTAVLDATSGKPIKTISPSEAAGEEGGTAGAEERKEILALWTSALEGLTEYEISATVVLRPDKSAKLHAHYMPNWLYQETIGLEADGDGMLKTTENTLTDRTKESLTNLAEAFAQSLQAVDGFGTLKSAKFFKTYKQGSKASPPELSAPAVAVRKLDLDVTFDPSDPVAVDRIKSMFNPVKNKHWELGGVELLSPFRLEMEVANETATGGKNSFEKPSKANSPDGDGLWFRPPTTYRIKVVSNMPLIMSKFKAQEGIPPVVALAVAKKFTIRDSDLEVSIPDTTRAFEWNIRRSAFIQKKVKLIVSQGNLQGFSVDKGSEVEGFTLIPLELAKIAAGIPKALVQNRQELTGGLNTVNANQRTLQNSSALDQQARLKAEADVLDQEIATRKKRKELKDLMRQESTAPAAP